METNVLIDRLGKLHTELVVAAKQSLENILKDVKGKYVVNAWANGHWDIHVIDDSVNELNMIEGDFENDWLNVYDVLTVPTYILLNIPKKGSMKLQFRRMQYFIINEFYLDIEDGVVSIGHKHVFDTLEDAVSFCESSGKEYKIPHLAKETEHKHLNLGLRLAKKTYKEW